MLCRCLLALAIVAFVPSASVAQEKPKRLPGDATIEKYLAAETDKLSEKFMDGAKTLDEWKEKLPRLKREYLDMLGLWPIPVKTPLKATVTGQVEAHGVVVEKLHFQSKPGLYVTANLYRPKASRERQRPEKLPAIVYVCGHSGKGRDGNKTAFQDHGFWFANNGYVCIVLDTLQLGEIPGVHHGTYGRPWMHLKSYEESRERQRPENWDKLENRFWWHSAGYTPAGVECWNGVRAIDYLLTRPEVDPDKIGVTGISGGGAATFWIAAADDRVKVAVPVSGMSDLESYVKNKVVNGHCDCMFLNNLHQWDWTTIAALVAPRPLLFANSDKDGIFPMDGNRRIIAKLRKLYAMYPPPLAPPSQGGEKKSSPPLEGWEKKSSPPLEGWEKKSSPPLEGGAGGVLEEYISPGGHDYRPDLRIAIFKFLNKHLKGDTTTPVEDSAKYTPLPGKELRVFPTDADVPKDAINARIDETFVPQAKVELPAEGQFDEWKKKMLTKVRQNFRGLLEDIPAAQPSPRRPQGLESLRTEPGIEAHILDGTPLGADFTKWKVQIQESEPASNMLLPGLTILPRGVIEPWTKISPPNYVERSHVLLGRTTDEGRLRDVIAIRRHHLKAGRKVDTVQLVGRRQAGILAAYAALLEPSINEVVLIEPPKSHKEGPHFLGILRVLDIPEALGLLAPAPLTIIGGNDPAFDRTAEIYKIAGAADKLTRR